MTPSRPQAADVEPLLEWVLFCVRAPAHELLCDPQAVSGSLGDLEACEFQLFKRTVCQFYQVIYFVSEYLY